MDTITIELEDWQLEAIKPLLDAISALADAGAPGMLIGQTVPPYHVRFGVVDRPTTLRIQEAMGTEVGKLLDGTVLKP
jgi:hypothetical protein